MADSADEKLIKDLVENLRSGKWLIAASVATCAVAGVIYAQLAAPSYTAETLIQSVQASKGSSPYAGIAAQFGLPGAIMGGGGEDKAVALATLKSRALIGKFIQRRNLAARLDKAHEGEAAEKREWDAYRVFINKVLKVNEDRKTGLITVSVQWSDPKEAAEWAQDIVASANEYMRSVAIAEGERNLKYLEEVAAESRQLELQKAIYALIESELKKVMLAKGNAEFALKTLDPAVVPQVRSWPKKTQIVLFSLAFGLFVGVGLAAVGGRSLKGLRQ